MVTIIAIPIVPLQLLLIVTPILVTMTTNGIPDTNTSAIVILIVWFVDVGCVSC